MKNTFASLCVLFVFALSLAAAVPDVNERQTAQTTIDGYSNTPFQPAPHEKWHIHDPDRTQPDAAAPEYDGQPVAAIEGATQLFDGSSLEGWTNKGWGLDAGAMVARKGAQKSQEHFGDCHLHVEWMVPAGLKGWGQKQGNSGVFLMNRYEIQVLNCWANRTYPDGMTGAIYGQTPPLVNACRKPGEWQAYDIHFKAPIFKDNALVSPAWFTVYLNNVLIQDNVEVRGPTTWRRLPQYKAHGDTGPIQLQSHGSPVRYRNVWIAPLTKSLGKP